MMIQSNKRRRFSRSARASSTKLMQRAAAVSLEMLEGRVLMSSGTVYTVTNTNDSGSGSLRDAITQANANITDTSTINFDATAFPSNANTTITLTTGDLELTNTTYSITIAGPGPQNLTIDAGNDSGVFFIDPGVTATLNNMTISGGSNTSGAGIDNVGTLTVDSAAIKNNIATGGGGGIENSGVLMVTNSTLTNNVGQAHGGGIDAAAGAHTTVVNTTIDGNASYFGGGLWSDDSAGTSQLTITDSTISHNIALPAGRFGGSSGNGGSGVFINGSNTGNTNLIQGSIVAENSGATDFQSADAYMVQDSMINGSVQLSALGYYGGPTETVVPLDSALIGKGGDFSLGTDQRGMVRTGTFDIGAFQTQGANSFIVNTNSDDPVIRAKLSLRDAAALASVTGGTQTVTFDGSLAGDTITLNGTAISINDSAGILTIDGGMQGIAIDGNAQSSIFAISSGSNVTIQSLTITNGAGVDGGAISNAGTLSLSDDVITNNTAASNSRGGAIFNTGTLSLSNSSVTGNTGISGGAIYNYVGATLNIQSTAFSSNSANYGGVINNSGAVTIGYSTISGNTATNAGGAIYNYNYHSPTSASATIYNSTISDNRAMHGAGIENAGDLTVRNSTLSGNGDNTTLNGGAIYSGLSSASLTVVDSTIANNTSTAGGGGIFLFSNESNSSTAVINGSIVAGNLGGGSGGDDISGNGDSGAIGGTLTGSYDLIGDGTNASTLTNTLSGTTASPLDPKLSALGNFGGPTRTMAPLSGSPAIGAGSDFSLTTDQRGIARPNGTTFDIGAFQSGALVVTTNLDNDTLGVLTLRDAVAVANASGGDQTITFDSALTGDSIMLLGTQLEISDSTGMVTIDGTSRNITVNAQANSRVFQIDPGATVTINSLTITNGSALLGAGIDNLGTLTLLNSTITGNTASNKGGGIYNYLGTVTLANSTVTGNHGTTGAGLYNTFDATLNVYSSTISNNAASGNGGGIQTSGTMLLVGSHITSNSAVGGAGLLNGSTGVLTIQSTEISSNTASGDGGGLFDQGSATIENATVISSNTAVYGGGIFASGTLVLTDSTIQGNSASTNGGGLFANNTTVTISRSGIFSNSSGNTGGGIMVNGATVAIENTTLEGNSSTFAGAAIYDFGTVNLTDSTTSGSTSGSNSGAIYNDSSTLNINGTIVANTLGGGPNLAGTGTTQGNNNLIDDAGTGLTGTNNLLSTPAGLGTLGFYGGITETMPLTSGSAAIGAGSDFGVTTDQRGVARPNGISFDIGAFQSGPMVVNTTADIDGVGLLTLRDAVNVANASGGAQDITFASGVTGTISLNSVLNITDTTGTVTITGPGQDNLTLDGQNQDRIFVINTGVTAAIGSVTMTNGTANGGSGGAISDAGTLTIADSTISFSVGKGGAINSSGTLTITNSTITENSSPTNGGGIYMSGTTNISGSTLSNNSADGNGGGIINDHGTLTITDTTISGNTANNGAGAYNYYGTTGVYSSTITSNAANTYGGGIMSYGGPLIISDTNVNSNSAETGGAIYAGTNAGLTTITGSAFTNNSAGTYGGAIADDSLDMSIADSTFNGNTSSDGSAIYFHANGSSQLTITSSTIQTNTATRDNNAGAAIGGYSPNASDTLTITDTTISGNTGVGISVQDVNLSITGSAISNNLGGGVTLTGAQNATLQISSSTISGNSTYYGAGVYNTGDATITNSTISANAASRAGGGIDNKGSLTIYDSTISANSAPVGGGIYQGNATATLLIDGSIVAGNAGGGAGGDDISGSSGGALSGTYSGSYDLIGDGTNVSGLTNSQLGTTATPIDAMLAPLGDYNDAAGGLQTMALLPGSPAITANNPTDTQTVDQRGISRPTGQSDIGAFQSRGFALGVTGGDSQSAPVTSAFADNLEVTFTANDKNVPVNNQAITFTAPATGASTNFSATPISIMTNSTGIAWVTASANGTVGSYVVTASNPNVPSAAFNLENTTGAATITLGSLNQTYTGSAEAASATTIPAGLAVVITYSQDGNPVAFPTDAGSYDVTATVNDPNWAGSTTGILVISPATVTITLGDLNQTYTGSGLAATATTDPTGLGVTITYSQNGNAVTTPTNAGSYDVAASSSDPNYTGTATGTLVISPATVTITLGDLNQIYTGSSLAATATTDPTGLGVSITYSQNGNAVAAPTNAGSYDVSASSSDPNYTGSATGSLVISPATATITLGNLNQTYTGAGRTVTAATTPAGLSVTIVYSQNGQPVAAPTAQGAYDVTATVNDPNYAGSATGTLTIAGQSPAITSSNSLSLTAGQAGSLTITTTGQPTTAITETGNLPDGLSFVDNGDGTATISGTATLGTQGTYTLTIAASNGIAPDATQALTLSVAQPTSSVSDIGVQFVSIPDSVVPGKKNNKVKLTFTNSAADKFHDSVSVQLVASPTANYDPRTATVLTSKDTKLNLKTDKHKNLTLKFSSPDSIATGDYHIIALVNSGQTATASDTTAHFEAPTMDLAATFDKTPPTSVAGKHKGAVKVRITNNGNVDTNGNTTVTLFASADQTLNTVLDTKLDQLLSKAKIKAGKSKVFNLKMTSSQVPAGSYYLIATVTNDGAPVDNSLANNTVISDATVAFSA